MTESNWTAGDDETIKHVEKIASGVHGHVYKVPEFDLNLMQMLDKNTNEVDTPFPSEASY